MGQIIYTATLCEEANGRKNEMFQWGQASDTKRQMKNESIRHKLMLDRPGCVRADVVSGSVKT